MGSPAPTCVAPGLKVISYVFSASQGLLTLQTITHSGRHRDIFVFLRHVPHLPREDSPDASDCLQSVVCDKKIKPSRSLHLKCIPWLLRCVGYVRLCWGLANVVDVFLVDAKVEDGEVMVDG